MRLQPVLVGSKQDRQAQLQEPPVDRLRDEVDHADLAAARCEGVIARVQGDEDRSSGIGCLYLPDQRERIVLEGLRVDQQHMALVLGLDLRDRARMPGDEQQLALPGGVRTLSAPGNDELHAFISVGSRYGTRTTSRTPPVTRRRQGPRAAPRARCPVNPSRRIGGAC